MTGCPCGASCSTIDDDPLTPTFYDVTGAGTGQQEGWGSNRYSESVSISVVTFARARCCQGRGVSDTDTGGPDVAPCTGDHWCPSRRLLGCHRCASSLGLGSVGLCMTAITTDSCMQAATTHSLLSLALCAALGVGCSASPSVCMMYAISDWCTGTDGADQLDEAVLEYLSGYVAQCVEDNEVWAAAHGSSNRTHQLI